MDIIPLRLSVTNCFLVKTGDKYSDCDVVFGKRINSKRRE
ncbi:MAG: hypothetical protein H6Q73_3825 [Firmicutes bacterium]|nr:hypothetical protein [Bacillota bacterium]